MTLTHPLPELAHRHWDLRHAGERPWTINKVAQVNNRYAWAGHTKTVRALWARLAIEAGVPHLARARIVVLPLHRDRRSPQDVGAAAPEAKAAIDGLVDAGVLSDDNPAFLLAITFLPPHICGDNGLHLRIEEA